MTTAYKSSADEICASRDLQTLTNEADIGALVDRLAPNGLHLEAWVPKFALDGAGCDLRIVPMGEDNFIRVRSSASPMTNLHLGAARSDADPLRRRVGQAHWLNMLDTARRVATVFPGLRTAGIDLAFLGHPRDHVVFEINAFGSFVKDGADGPCMPYHEEAASLAAALGEAREAAL
jgi:hypothetical protein